MKALKRFRWLSSPANRGNIVLTHGNVYDNDTLKKPIDPESAEIWEKEGLLERIDKGEKPIEIDTDSTTSPSPEIAEIKVKTSDETKVVESSAEKKSDEVDETEEDKIIEAVDSSDLVKVRGLEIETPFETSKEHESFIEKNEESKPIVSYPKDAKEFSCTKTDCYRFKNPYNRYWDFRRHMEKKHDETWIVEGDNIVKKED